MVYGDLSARSAERRDAASLLSGVLSVELEINVSADRAWAAVKDLPNSLPRLMPQLLHEVKFTHGDGGVGSVREVRIPSGPFCQPNVSNVFAEAVIDFLDDSSRTEIHRIIGGKIMNNFTFYRCTKTFTPANDGKSCIASWKVEYEVMAMAQGKVEASKKSVYAILYGLEEYLSKSDAYVGGVAQ